MTGRPEDDLGFSWQQQKDGSVQVHHHGRLASTLRGDDAADFLTEVEAVPAAQAQQRMARITGNYKRGNERLAKTHPRNRG
jgi:hypothetical protein